MANIAAMLAMVILALLEGGCAASVVSSKVRQAPISCEEAILPAWHRQAPQPLSSSLPENIQSRYAIFRRLAEPSDMPRGGTKMFVNGLASYFEMASYYDTYVRRLSGLSGGHEYFVVPGFARPRPLYPLGCGTVAQRRSRAEERRHRATEPIFCIGEISGDEKVVPISCEPFAAIAHGVAIFESNGVMHKPLVQLAPNGVKAIRIDYREAPPTVARVTDNTFSFTPSPPSVGVGTELALLAPKLSSNNGRQRLEATRLWDAAVDKTRPIKVEWIGDDGKLLRALEPPSDRTVEAIAVGNLRAPVEGQ
jgi:hypothetical protein